MKYRIANPARARKIGQEIFSLTEGGDLLTLGNESAVLLWERLCQDPADASDLAATLQQVYRIDDATALKDAQAFLDRLLPLGVLVRVEGAGA